MLQHTVDDATTLLFPIFVVHNMYITVKINLDTNLHWIIFLVSFFLLYELIVVCFIFHIFAPNWSFLNPLVINVFTASEISGGGLQYSRIFPPWLFVLDLVNLLLSFKLVLMFTLCFLQVLKFHVMQYSYEIFHVII